MSKDWKIIYYEAEDGYSEVYEYIENLKSSNKAKMLSWLSILEEKGPLLTRPYADLLRETIHELRIKLSGNQIRVLYFFCYEEFIILTSNFMKNTDKVPEKEIKKALKHKESFLSRFPEDKLRKAYYENI